MKRRCFLAVVGGICGAALARAQNPARHPLLTFPDENGTWSPVRTTALSIWRNFDDGYTVRVRPILQQARPLRQPVRDLQYA